MEKNIELSKELDLDIKVKEGKVELSLSSEMKGAGIALSVSLDPEYFGNKRAAAIPGQVDDAIIAMLIAALKK